MHGSLKFFLILFIVLIIIILCMNKIERFYWWRRRATRRWAMGASQQVFFTSIFCILLSSLVLFGCFHYLFVKFCFEQNQLYYICIVLTVFTHQIFFIILFFIISHLSLISSIVCVLRLLCGLWESIVVESSIKQRLLGEEENN